MWAAILWYEESDDSTILAFLVRIGDLLVKQFGEDPRKLYSIGALEQNQSIIYSIARLYVLTGNEACESKARIHWMSCPFSSHSVISSYMSIGI